MMKTEKNLGQCGYAHRRKFQREAFQMRITLLCSVTDLNIYQDKREAPTAGGIVSTAEAVFLKLEDFHIVPSSGEMLRVAALRRCIPM
jgi:hypothetical protein